jgi:hypothetical protein
MHLLARAVSRGRERIDIPSVPPLQAHRSAHPLLLKNSCAIARLEMTIACLEMTDVSVLDSVRFNFAQQRRRKPTSFPWFQKVSPEID